MQLVQRIFFALKIKKAKINNFTAKPTEYFPSLPDIETCRILTSPKTRTKFGKQKKKAEL